MYNCSVNRTEALRAKESKDVDDSPWAGDIQKGDLNSSGSEIVNTSVFTWETFSNCSGIAKKLESAIGKVDKLYKSDSGDEGHIVFHMIGNNKEQTQTRLDNLRHERKKIHLPERQH